VEDQQGMIASAHSAECDRCSMELFAPNNLSVGRPRLISIDEPALLSRISQIARSVYQLPDASRIQLAKFAGANVVSDNLAVTVGDKRFFLKSRKGSQKDSLEAETSLALRLHGLGLKVPQVIKTAEGESCFVDEDRAWALYRFEDGDYFTGKGDQLDSAAKEFGKLTRVINAMDDPRRDDRNVGLNGSFLESLPATVDESKNSEHTVVRELCLDHSAKIFAAIDRVRDDQPEVESDVAVMHLDYHPLNLLIRNDEVECVLDLEQVKPYYLRAGLGFAAYKLIRQTLVDSERRTQEFAQPRLVDRWIAASISQDSRLCFDKAALGSGARYRILFLVNSILDCARHGDTRFNYDLEKQLLSLYEIDVIFG
jgi:aminoglycoside phosphotransferase (APT) family kinase protein